MSPLLTSACFWQLKEWRWDRLLEHLRREGWIVPLFGKIRPVVLVSLYGLFFLLPIAGDMWLVGSLVIFTVLTVSQIVLRAQRRPVPTRKALALVAGNLVLTSLATVGLFAGRLLIFLPLLVLLQPLILAVSWTAFRPVDRFLKLRVMKRARSARASHPSLTVIGITGSVGKTTTKELLSHLLSDHGAAATPAHVNSEMGVSGWLTTVLSAEKAPAILIVEMGAYRKGEIALLCSIVQPTIGVVTHVGNQHLALFGSQEALAEAKSELIRGLPPDGRAFLNADSERVRAMKETAPCPVTLVGTGGEADLEAFEIEEEAGGIRFRTADTLFIVPLHGTHNVTNVLLAIAVARSLGMDLTAIRDRLRTFRPPSHTFSVREERGVRILDDTHNSSPASFKAAIAWAKTQPFAKKTLLASGLIELGEEQERTHVELGGAAAEVFDRVIFIDDRSAKEFERGYGKAVELMKNRPAGVGAGELLVCVGRMPLSQISRLLPILYS